MAMRVSGLASGMDIDTIVKGLVDAQRAPLDKLYQNKVYTEWQRDDYRTINTALSEFDKLIADGVGRQATFIQKTVSVSNPDVLSVKNINSTSDFSGTIKDVTQLASAATMVSTAASTGTTNTTALSAQTITIQAINKDGGFDATPYKLDIKEGDTLESVIEKINADSGVTVFFDEKSKQFSITAKNTGSAGATAATAAIQLTSDLSDSDASNLFKGVMKMDALNSTDATNGSAGTNASLNYNGLTITRSSNTFTLNGAEITLKKPTTNTDSITFSSTSDTDAIVKKVKEFVDSYNALIANISGKISEKKDKGFPPLTDAQKKDMKEDEIKLWESKAKKGTLRNDSSLRSLLTNMRSSLYTSVSGSSVKNLSNIGIGTTKDYLSGGKLEINETKLREAIADNPNAIYDLFMKDDGDDKSTAGDGLVRRLRANLDLAVKDINDKAGKTTSVGNNNFSLGRLLNTYEDKISSFEERITSLETRYYKQFTAMEKAIQNSNSQSASLSSYFTS